MIDASELSIITKNSANITILSSQSTLDAPIGHNKFGEVGITEAIPSITRTLGKLGQFEIEIDLYWGQTGHEEVITSNI